METLIDLNVQLKDSKAAKESLVVFRQSNCSLAIDKIFPNVIPLKIIVMNRPIFQIINED